MRITNARRITNLRPSSGSSLPLIELFINFGTGSVSGWVYTGDTSPSVSATTDYSLMSGSNSTGIGLRSTSTGTTYRWNATGTSGASTGANSGVFPDGVLKTFWFASSTDIGRFELYNHTGTPLNGRSWRIEIAGSRASITGPRTSQYRINGGAWQTLDVDDNTANSVTFTGITVSASVILVEIQNTTPSDAAFAYINGLKLTSE